MRHSILSPIISELEKQGLEVTRCLRNVRLSAKERYSTMRLDVNGTVCALHHITSCTKEEFPKLNRYTKLKLSKKTLREVDFVIVKLEIKDFVDQTLFIPVSEFYRRDGSINFCLCQWAGFTSIDIGQLSIRKEWRLKNCRYFFEAC